MKKKIVILTGAGISAESGIPTFRATDGLWMNYNVDDVATPQGWLKNPAMVLEFYNLRRAEVAKAQPNIAHKKLAELEDNFDIHIITQNIDDLHERGGSTKILHLHGEIFKSRSNKFPDYVYDCKGDINIGDLCENGSQLRPHVVWFNEMVPALPDAEKIIMGCDYFVVIGTSLQVSPASSLIDYASQAKVIVIDPKKPILSSFFRNKAIYIEKNATEGVIDLEQLLMKEITDIPVE